MTFKISRIGHLSTFSSSKDVSFLCKIPVEIFCLMKVKMQGKVKMNPQESSALI